MYNNEILSNNIKYIIGNSHEKISEIESNLEISTGYISRMIRDSKIKPGIDFIFRFSEYFNVSIDSLLKVNLQDFSKTERYLYKFLEKLRVKTQLDELKWEKETKDYYKQNKLNDDFINPIIIKNELNDEYLGTYYESVIISNRYGSDTFIENDCFRLLIGINTYVYFMNISKASDFSNDTNCIEVWILKDYKSQFLCGNYETEKIAPYVNNVYNLVAEKSNHPIINEDVKTIIDMFMEDEN